MREKYKLLNYGVNFTPNETMIPKVVDDKQCAEYDTHGFADNSKNHLIKWHA